MQNFLFIEDPRTKEKRVNVIAATLLAMLAVPLMHVIAKLLKKAANNFKPKQTVQLDANLAEPKEKIVGPVDDAEDVYIGPVGIVRLGDDWVLIANPNQVKPNSTVTIEQLDDQQETSVEKQVVTESEAADSALKETADMRHKMFGGDDTEPQEATLAEATVKPAITEKTTYCGFSAGFLNAKATTAKAPGKTATGFKPGFLNNKEGIFGDTPSQKSKEQKGHRRQISVYVSPSPVPVPFG